MPALALDIGTYAIKALAGKSGNTITVERSLEVANPTGLALPTDDATSQKLQEYIGSLFSDHKLPKNDVRLSLPETIVSTKIISIPPLSDAELASAIGWQAEQHIPIPSDELALEYSVLFRPARGVTNETMRVLMIGARKAMIDRFIDIFTQLGIEPTILETQAISVVRSLEFTPEDETTLVVVMGASTMDMFVVHEGELVFVFTHLNGGGLLTKALEQSAQLDSQQAEEYKRAYGIDESHFEGKIRNMLIPSVRLLVQEIQKAQQFFIQQFPGKSVQRILLTGGASQLPDLAEFVASTTGTEVLTAAPFSNAKGQIPNSNHPAFSVCVGLLMRQ